VTAAILMAAHPMRLSAVIAIAVIGLAGCVDQPSDSLRSASPAPASQTSAEPTGTTTAPAIPARIEKWITLRVGDCLAGPPPVDPAVVTVTVVDCAQPHLAEVFLRANIPVDAAVTGIANQQCEAGLAQYTGLAANSTPFAISYLIDSEQDRTSNNPYPSTVICLLQDAQGQTRTTSARR
jgi:hypothetical protein